MGKKDQAAAATEEEVVSSEHTDEVETPKDDGEPSLWDDLASEDFDEDEGTEEVAEADEPSEESEEVTEESATSEEEAVSEESTSTEEEPESQEAEETTEEAAASEEETAPEETAAEETAVTPEQEIQNFDDWMTSMEDAFTQRYQLSEEDAAAIVTEPETVLPRMAARIHMDAYMSITSALNAQLPQIINAVMDRNSLDAKVEQDFFEAWPALNTEEGRTTADRMAQIFRMNNPTVSTEDAIREIGAAAMVALRIPIPGAEAQPEGMTQAALAAQPHRPAPARPAPARQPQARGNEYEQMADEFLAEDDD